MSCEATRFFLHPIGADENEYHERVRQPISLTQIEQKLIDSGYKADFKSFWSDVQLMVDNAVEYNLVDTAAFQLSVMMQREVETIKEILNKQFHDLQIE